MTVHSSPDDLCGVLKELTTVLRDKLHPRREWLSIKHAAEEYDISERKLRAFLGHETHPLPARLVGGKWLVSRSDMDNWLRSFPRAGEDLDQLVDELIEEMRDKTRK
jgi:hypothetical protein